VTSINPISLFCSGTCVEHPISTSQGVQTHKFYTITPRLVGQLRGMVKPIFKAFSLFSSTSVQDVGREAIETRGANGEQQTKTLIQPISDTLAKTRAAQRDQAIDLLVESLMSDGAINQLVIVCMDSMRDAFPNRGKVASEVAEMADKISVATLIEMLKGVAKANQEVIAPFREKLGMVGQIFQRVASRVTEQLDRDDAPSGEPQPATPTTNSG
jgi:hypothetical protein